MPEYIERESAYPLAKRICDAIDSEEFQRLNFGLRILDWIDEVPAVDVRPVVRGKWKKAPCHETDEAYTYICPFCRWYMIAIEPMNFCPNCGADMKEAPESHDCHNCKHRTRDMGRECQTCLGAGDFPLWEDENG